MLEELPPPGQHYFHIFSHQNRFWITFLHSLSQLEVICEAREDWWNALLAWLRSLGGSQGICDILQRLLDFTNSLIHLVDCHLSYKPDPECSKTFLANQLAWLKEHDVSNTEQLNFTSKAVLTIVVIFTHLALSALILAFILPFICNFVGFFNAGEEEEERSTHSLVIRVTDPDLVANLCKLQESIVAHEPILHDACMKPSLFHITIGMLRLVGQEGLEAAQEMMEGLRPVFKEMFLDVEAATLQIDGLGNFGQRVVYANVSHHRVVYSFAISIHLVRCFIYHQIFTLSPVQVEPRSEVWFNAFVDACRVAVSTAGPMVIALQSKKLCDLGRQTGATTFLYR